MASRYVNPENVAAQGQSFYTGLHPVQYQSGTGAGSNVMGAGSGGSAGVAADRSGADAGRAWQYPPIKIGSVGRTGSRNSSNGDGDGESSRRLERDAQRLEGMIVPGTDLSGNRGPLISDEAYDLAGKALSATAEGVGKVVGMGLRGLRDATRAGKKMWDERQGRSPVPGVDGPDDPSWTLPPDDEDDFPDFPEPPSRPERLPPDDDDDSGWTLPPDDVLD